MRVLFGVEPTGEVSKEIIEHILSLNPQLRKTSISPCKSLYCKMKLVDDQAQQDQISEKVDQAMEDYFDAHNLDMKDPR